MAAKDYKLAVTGLTNSVWICKQSKKNPNLMTDDRVKIDESDFIGILMEWAVNKAEKDKCRSIEIKTDGKVIAEISINIEHPLLKSRFDEIKNTKQ